MSARKLVLSVFVVVVGVMMFAVAPALADETPETPSAVVPTGYFTATEAVLEGVLNPGRRETETFESEEYFFLYNKSAAKVGCEGGGVTASELSSGAGDQHVGLFVGGLEAGTEYTVCLGARSLVEHKEAVSAPISFETRTPPETPETGPATEIAGTTATFNGVLNPKKIAGEQNTYQFFYNQSETKCEIEAGEQLRTPEQTAVGNKQEVVTAPVVNLLPKTKYTYCLRVENSGGESAIGAPETFETTTAPPAIIDESYTNIQSDEVTLTAEISPGGAPTTYQVEYEPGKLTPPQTLPGLSKSITVNETITHLQPGAEYHAHFIASNGIGSPVAGADDAFTTLKLPLPSPLGLPDGRAYELVSTIENMEVFPPAAGQTSSFESKLYGELIATQGGFRAAANGEAVAYIGGLPPSGQGGYGVGKNHDGNLYLSARGTNGWAASDIDAVSNSRLIEGFSADLSQQFFNIGEPKFDQAHGGTSDCTGEVGEIYSRIGGLGVPAYRALIPAASASGEECEHLTFAGTSADDAHVLFQSQGAYTPGAVKGEEGNSERPTGLVPAEGFDNLYDSVNGQLYQVNVLPDGKPEPSPAAIYGGRSSLLERKFEHNFSGDVSTDGSRVFWTSLGTGDLYVRQNDTQPQSMVEGERCTEPTKACTVQIDRVQPGATGTSGGGQFWAASGDGSKVFFTDCSRLTEGSTAVSGGGCAREEFVNNQIGERNEPTGNDLYEYDLTSGRLTDLTVDSNSTDALGADVQGVVGASVDGSSVYFVANGVLAEEDAEGRKPVAGQPNLYLHHAGNPTPTFIATLSSKEDKTDNFETLGRDDNEFNGLGEGAFGNVGSLVGDWRAEPGLRTAAVAPTGKAVTFMSRLPLTGYDNNGIVAVDGAGERHYGNQPEVFVYETDSGRIVCASCTPTGKLPAPAAEGWENGGGGHVSVSGSSTFMSRFINTEGTQVYFDTSQPLVSRDTNNRQDVYEWEANGSGDCAQLAGCVRLLSGGDSPHDAYFLDASESGDDVFFTSREQLLPKALNENVKLYDARVGVGFPESALACEGTACQGAPPAAPIFSSPSTATIDGVDDVVPSAPAKVVAKSLTRAQKLAAALKTCRRKKPKSKRAVCEKAARKKYGAIKRTKKPSNDRRAK